MPWDRTLRCGELCSGKGISRQGPANDNGEKQWKTRAYIPIVAAGVPNDGLEYVCVVAPHVRVVGLVEHGLECQQARWAHSLAVHQDSAQVLPASAAFGNHWQLLLHLFILWARERKNINIRLTLSGSNNMSKLEYHWVVSLLNTGVASLLRQLPSHLTKYQSTKAPAVYLPWAYNKATFVLRSLESGKLKY